MTLIVSPPSVCLGKKTAAPRLPHDSRPGAAGSLRSSFPSFWGSKRKRIGTPSAPPGGDGGAGGGGVGAGDEGAVGQTTQAVRQADAAIGGGQRGDLLGLGVVPEEVGGPAGGAAVDRTFLGPQTDDAALVGGDDRLE